MDMISCHFIQTILHDQWQGLKVSSMDHVIKCEWVCDFLQELLVLHCVHCVSLHCSDESHSLFFSELISFFVIVGNDIVDYSRGDTMLFH